jgi:flavin-dependent dehydrogenase
MSRATQLVLRALVSALLVSSSAFAAEPRRADVVVYGATASGVIAAVAAAREGKTVLLLEPGQHLGGMVSGGLGATDTGNRSAIGGYSREFFDRVREHYVQKYGADSAQVKDCSGGFHFEPHVAEQVFKEMLQEAKVEVLFGQRLDKLLPLSATPSGKRIAGFTTLKGDDFRAAVWIDASYEGDLMARAGVRYTIGREGRDEYQESIAGVQAHSPAHQWPVKISPFAEGDKAYAMMLLPFVQPGPAGGVGAADKKVQAYNFRLCMTDRKDNQVPFPKPPGYDPKRYELLARYLAKKPDLKVGQLMNPVRMPNGKTDTNNNGPFSTDHIGANWDYPDADHATRERIWKHHVEYVQGFCYFLANDPHVPEALHKEMASWGLAKDEFFDTDHWPHQLYVREARRMLGAYFMTQADIMEQRTKPDSVGLGSYNTDSHHCQRVPTADGAVLNEGDFQVHVSPYAISYRSLVPRPAECENLLVPVCLSASHVAYGTIRMEPVYMILGQATGVAAALALDNETPVQNIPIDKLLDKLRAQKAVLSPEGLGGSGSGAQKLDPSKLPGIVIDDVEATKVGDWKGSSAVGPYVGNGYLHDDNQNKGKMSVRFIPKLPETGRYEVCIVYSPNPNRATNTPVLIHHADGEQTVRVNQRLPLKDNKPLRLGIFSFAAGEKGWVELRNDDTDGHVIADAVQFILVR